MHGRTAAAIDLARLAVRMLSIAVLMLVIDRQSKICWSWWSLRSHSRRFEHEHEHEHEGIESPPDSNIKR